MRQKFQISERLACRVLGQHRSTQRKVPQGRADEEALTADIVALASQYGRYGYRRITALLREAGWAVNAKRVERIWRRDFGGSGKAPVGRFPDGAEGSPEAAQEGSALAERRVLHPSAAGAAEPRPPLGILLRKTLPGSGILRLRREPDA